jgi:hypothetical protein
VDSAENAGIDEAAERVLLVRPKGWLPVERCLACEAEGVATHGAAPTFMLEAKQPT